jgi:alpha/beta superfamily hydrolase
MSLQLITLTTQDGVELDGGWYLPPAGAVRRSAAILVVHGLTWNFYRGPARWLPPLLSEAGFACLALNMRDHDLAEPKDFDRAHHDLRTGIDFLQTRGPGEVVLLAHGYACNKLVAYAAQSGDHRPWRQVLTTLGSIKSYRPEIWEQVLEAAAALRGDSLVVQGAVDPLIEPRRRADELVAAAGLARVEVVLLEGGDHYFNDRHQALADCVLHWLVRSPEGRP